LRHNLKNFNLKSLCSPNDPELESTEVIHHLAAGTRYRIGEKPYRTFTPSFTAKNLPTVIGHDGLPWDLACYYLTYSTIHQIADPASIQKYAVHLSEYYDFCISEEIDPLLDTPSKRKRPIFRFREKLLGSVRDSEITDRTANNKIGNIVRFYRWLIEENGHVYKHRPFSSDSFFISYVKGSGNVDHKLVQSHDARIKVHPKSVLPSENLIVDDGRLRPLPSAEQEVLFSILENQKNTEMVLIIIFALTTGARIQSVLTLRHKHFRVESDPDSAVPLAIGHGTYVDSKHSQKQVLMIPTFIQKKLAIYSHSKRSKNRFEKYCQLRGLHASEEAMGDCYLFLSNQGHPFYDAKSDLFKFDKSQVRANPRTGDSIRKFLKQHILPTMRKQFGEQYHFQFHDLRATYGINLVEACNVLVDKSEMDASAVVPFVQSRMNHKDSKTTESYIQYNEKIKQAEEIVETFQSSLLDRIRAVLGELQSEHSSNDFTSNTDKPSGDDSD